MEYLVDNFSWIIPLFVAFFGAVSSFLLAVKNGKLKDWFANATKKAKVVSAISDLCKQAEKLAESGELAKADKKTFVIAKVKEFMNEIKVNLSDDFVSQTIEEVISISKKINKRS